MRQRALLLLTTTTVVALAVGLVLFALDARPAHADTTFTVNSTEDDVDGDPADGVCDAFALGDPGRCTLRAAMEQANATAGADTINFHIPGPGGVVQTISPASALPDITEAVTIDGYTQFGASPNTQTVGSNAALVIELNGTNSGGANGLNIAASNSVVKGLVINRWIRGVYIFGSGATGNKVEGNYIGTDASGTQDLGNSNYGVVIDGAPNNTVGGTATGATNVISGNGGGIFIFGREATRNKVEGNLIGTDKDGTQDLGNASQGVLIDGARVSTVGGTATGAANVISGNNTQGIILQNSSSQTKVEGNYIGTDASGTQDLGNSSQGVAVNNTSEITVGGTATGAANVIAFNGKEGVRISCCTATGIRILSNSIFDNDGLGIDLQALREEPGSVTPNDPGDGDTGPNNLQNFPVITSATTSSVTGATIIQGSLNSTPNKTFAIQLFSNLTPDPSGNGEGKTYIGQTTATTNGGGDASFTFTPTSAVPLGQVVTATATGEQPPPTCGLCAPPPRDDNTSEFSAGVAVRSTGVLQFSSATYSVDEAGPSATITVTRSDGSVGPATVDYTTGSGTASLGTDYVGVAGTLNFADGQTSRTFLVPIGEDTLDEPNETVGLQLSGATGAALGSPSNATLTIVDNDEPPDATPPTVTDVTPDNQQTGVARNTPVTATFSEEMNPATLTTSTVLMKVGRKKVPVGISCDTPCKTLTLDPYPSEPSRLLAAKKKYKVTIKTGAKDKAGNALDQNSTTSGNQPMVWTFTTGST